MLVELIPLMLSVSFRPLINFLWDFGILLLWFINISYSLLITGKWILNNLHLVLQYFSTHKSFAVSEHVKLFVHFDPYVFRIINNKHFIMKV